MTPYPKPYADDFNPDLGVVAYPPNQAADEDLKALTAIIRTAFQDQRLMKSGRLALAKGLAGLAIELVSAHGADGPETVASVTADQTAADQLLWMKRNVNDLHSWVRAIVAEVEQCNETANAKPSEAEAPAGGQSKK